MDEQDPRSALLEQLALTLSELEVRYKATRNPVYVWEAISAQHFLWRHPKRFGGTDFQLILPSWVTEYLVRAAGKVTLLNKGCVVTEKQTETLGRYTIAAVDGGKLKEKVSALFGLTDDGGNAFKRYHSTRQDLRVAARFKELRESGLSRTAAIERITQETGAVEASVVSKRIARGKRLIEQIKAARPRNRTTG